MLSRDDHEGLVARLYASAMGDATWTETLEHLSGLFGVGASVLAVADSTRRPLTSENHGYSADFAAQYYSSEIYAKDPRTPYIYQVRPGSLYFDHALYDVEAMNRDPGCRASVDLLNVQYQLGAVLDLPHGAVGFFAVLSTAKEGHATEAAIAAFRRLAPHLQQACALGYLTERKAAEREALLEALDQKADGVLLLGFSGALVFGNDTALAALRAGDGLSVVGDLLQTARGPETRRLHRLIADATAASMGLGAWPGGRMLVSRPSGRRPYMLRVMAAPAQERFLTGRGVACVIHLHDLAAENVPSKQALSMVFGLTDREADLAVELARCASLAQAAANCGMAGNTARNHLQSIFRKSGASSQAEAVQLFARIH